MGIGIRNKLSLTDGNAKVQITNGTKEADIITCDGHNGLITISPGHVSTDNSTTDVLTANNTYTGTWEDVTNFGVIVITIKASHASATDGLSVEFSSDGTNIDSSDNFTIPATTGKTFSFQAATQYFRVKYTNSGTNQTYFRLQTILKPYYVKPSSHRISDSIISDDDAELVKAVLTGSNPAGDFVNFQSTTSGNFKVSLEELESGISSNSNSQLNTTLFNSSGLELKIDPTNGSICTSDYSHCEIHEGNHFYNKDWTDLANAAVYDILLVTPDTGRWGHLVFKVETESEANMIAYVGTTTSDNGTPMNTFNRNGNSSTTATLSIYHSPTITNVGTQVARYKGGSGKAIGGEIRSNNEVILKQNTKYLFRITNDTALNNWVDWLIDFYEHTNL